MPRYLTSAVQTALSATGTRVVLLATIRQTVPGLTRTVRLSSMSDGTNRGQFVLGSDTYYARIVTVPSFRVSVAGDGGVATLDSGELVFSNPVGDGTLWTDELDDGALDGAVIDFDLLIGASAVAADAIRIATGFIRESRYRAGLVTCPWLDVTARESAEWPTDRFDAGDYPFADTDLWGTPKRLLWGDLTGKAFDVSAANSAVWPHVPLPLIDGMAQKYYAQDVGTSDDQEEVVWVQGVPCTVPSGSRTLSGEYLQLDDNVLEGWLRPHRTITATGVDNTGYARSDSVDEYAEVGNGDVLEVGFPGASDTIGLYSADGTPAAADCEVYILMSTGSGAGNVEVTVKKGATTLVDAVTVGTTTTPTWSYTGDGTLDAIGASLSSIADLTTLTVKVEGIDADATRVHRILVKFRFRANEVLAAFEQQEVTRSMLGFVESSVAAAEDYQDGGYIDVPGDTQRTTPLVNPADIAEAIERRKACVGRRAPRAATSPFRQYEDPTVALAASTGNGTSLTVGSGEDQWFEVGDAIMVDAEIMRVTALPGSDVLMVQRGVAGSRVMYHASGASVYICPENGEVDTASFRAARRMLSDPDGTELVTNGCMEAFGGSSPTQVATGWTITDPSSKGSFFAGTGYTGGYSQSIQRTSSGGTDPGAYTSFTTTSGACHRLRFRAKASVAATITIEMKWGSPAGSGGYWTLSLTTSWQTFDLTFLASTSAYVYFRVSTVATVSLDDVSCQKLQEWAWAFPSPEERVNSRDWYNEALPHGRLRLMRDQFGRTSARAIDPFRASAATWGASDVVTDVRPATGGGGFDVVEPLEVQRSSDERCYTGVTVRYAWDEHRKRYLGSTWVGAKKESTGQVVSAVTDIDVAIDELTVDDTSDVYPATGWESRGYLRMATSGTDNKTLTFTSDTANAPTFQTSSVAAGSWAMIWDAGNGKQLLTRIASVNSETSITVEDSMWVRAAVDHAYNFLSVFPHLFMAGSAVFVPWVESGPGSEDPTGLIVLGTGGNFDPLHFGAAVNTEPVVGDVVYRLIPYSDDGSGASDQGRLLDADRERWAMQRLAVLGSERTLTVESPYIRDAFTAARLRDFLFDRAGFHYEGVVRTPLTKVGSEPADVVTLSHDLLPGGSLRVELTQLGLELGGVLTWRWREQVRPV